MRAKAEFQNVRQKGNIIITVFLRDNNQVVGVYKLKCVSILCKRPMRTDRQD
jgi:glutaredoxin-related protein